MKIISSIYHYDTVIFSEESRLRFIFINWLDCLRSHRCMHISNIFGMFYNINYNWVKILLFPSFFSYIGHSLYHHLSRVSSGLNLYKCPPTYSRHQWKYSNKGWQCLQVTTYIIAHTSITATNFSWIGWSRACKKVLP